MAPISYQGPLAHDERTQPTQSQTRDSNLGVGQPGLTVDAILGDKGRDIFTATPQMTVKEVVKELNRLRVGALVVVDSKNAPVGIVSERDIVRHADTKGLGMFDGAVEAIMTPDPITCTKADKVEEIMKRMTEGRFRHMPVVDAGILAGLVSIGDVVRHRMQEIEYENLKMKQAIVG